MTVQRKGLVYDYIITNMPLLYAPFISQTLLRHKMTDKLTSEMTMMALKVSIEQLVIILLNN